MISIFQWMPVGSYKRIFVPSALIKKTALKGSFFVLSVPSGLFAAGEAGVNVFNNCGAICQTINNIVRTYFV
jgi:hypothetical protein